jgi:hypothetical protein
MQQPEGVEPVLVIVAALIANDRADVEVDRRRQGDPMLGDGRILGGIELDVTDLLWPHKFWRQDRAPPQLANFCSVANTLRPSHTCMSAINPRSPVSSIRLAATAARTLSIPIQIAVMVLRSVET